MSQNPLTAALTGGAILAFWLYGLLFGFGIPWGTWFIWGAVGFAIGGAVYGLRFAPAAGRVLLVAGVGAVLSLLILGAILQGEAALWASFITALGSSVLVLAFPGRPEARPTGEPA